MWRLLCLLLAFTIAPGKAQTLLQDGDFESGKLTASWNTDPSIFSIDSQVKVQGKYSLKYENHDPGAYKLCSQRVPIKKGRAYKLSAWIQTQQIEGPEQSGATLALEWYSAQGKFLGGFYPVGYKGTNDWQRMQETSRVAPDEAAYAMLLAYVRPKCTGIAWFDDIKIEEAPPRAWKVMLKEPVWRGQLSPQNPTVKVGIELFDWLKFSDCKVKAQLTSASGEAVFTNQFKLTSAKSDYSLPLPSTLANGNYQLKLSLLDQTNQTRAEFETRLSKSANSPTPRVSFKNGVTFIDGKPFTPIGVYDDRGWKEGETDTRLKTLADAGFNTVLPYGLVTGGVSGIQKYLDAAQKLNLKVIVSIKDMYEGSRYEIKRVDQWATPKEIVTNIVSRFKDHPALLAWYTNDELGAEMVDKLNRNYQWITALDPNHPCYTVSNMPAELETFVNNSDVIGTDPYPVPGAPLEMVSDWTRATVDTGKPVWMVPQVFDKSVYFKGMDRFPPTFAQKRVMAYLALAGGAKGLIFYSFYDLQRAPDFEREWEQVKRLGLELKPLQDLIARGTPVENVGASAKLKTLALTLDGKLYVLSVNPTDAPDTLKLSLPKSYLKTGIDRINPSGLVRFEGSEVQLPAQSVRLLVFESANAQTKL